MYISNLKEKRELEDVKKSLSSQNKNLGNQKQKVEIIENEILVLKNKVENLESNSGGGSQNLAEVAITGRYNDLEGRPDQFFEMGTSFKASRNQVWGIDKNGGKSQEYWFTCAVDSVIEGTVEIVFRGTRRITSISEKIDFLFNDAIVANHSFTVLNPTDTTAVVSFKLRPKKHLNNFSVSFEKTGSWSGDCIIGHININISYGKNIFFLTRDFNWHATVYKDKYLISKNAYQSNIYYEKNKDDFDFSTGEKIFTTRIGKSLVLSYAPTYPSNSEFMTSMNYNEILAIGLNSDNNYPKVGVYNQVESQKMLSEDIVHSYSITYFRHLANSSIVPGIAIVVGQDRRLAFWESGLSGNTPLNYTLNGVEVEAGVWIDNNAVIKQDMDGVVARDYRGSVGMKFNGECIFFPHINSTYTVPVGFGRRVNAFLQDNQNIHVYLGRQNHVIKKVLVKNPVSEQYEIDPEQEMKIVGFDEVVETLDGFFIGLSDDLPELVSWQDI